MSNGLRFRVLYQVVTVFVVAIFLISTSIMWGCPFCDAPSTTLSEQLETSHAAVLARWISTEQTDPNNFSEGETQYLIVDAAGSGKIEFPIGSQFTVPRYQSGRPEDVCLIFATKIDDKLSWGLPTPIERECWDYILAAPPRTLPVHERLPFFLAALEHADPEIAMDAYGEFAGIPYEELRKIADLLPREKIIAWLSDPQTIPTRKGLFGLMLGLCGTSADVKFMAEIIQQQPEETRMGIDGLMAGYLLLTGNAGLEQLVTWKLRDPQTPDHETYALLKALEFSWSYGRDRVDAGPLRACLRQMLRQPQLTGLVIIDLARWQDWDVMDQLVAGYGQEPFTEQHVRQCIIRFLIAAEKDAAPPPGATSTGIDYSAKARTHLIELRKLDPATVKYVERYPFD